MARSTFGKLLSLLLALTLVISLGVATWASAESAAQPRTLTFLHWRTEDKDAFEKVAKDYEALHPGLTIEIEIVPTQDYAKTLIMRLQGGEAADVFAVSPDGDFITEYKTGVLLELNDCAEILNNFDEGALGSGTRDGVTYAVPQTTNPLAIYYNKDIFTKYNLAVPTTVDEFMNVCKTLKDNGVTPMAEAGGETWFPEFLVESLIANCMSDPTLFASGKIMDDEGIVDAVKITKQLFDSGYILEGSSGIKEESLLTGFAVGNYAMIATGTWSMSTIRKINDKLDFGLFNMPGTKGTLKGVSNTGLQLAINKNTQLMDDAKGFVAYLTSADVLTYFCNQTGQLAVAKDVKIESPDLAMAQQLLTGKDGFISAPFHQPNAKGLNICWNKTVALVTETVEDPTAFCQDWQDQLIGTLQ